jgi:hypothetical protein
MTLNVEQASMRPPRIRRISWKDNDVTRTMDEHGAFEIRWSQSFLPQ